MRMGGGGGWRSVGGIVLAFMIALSCIVGVVTGQTCSETWFQPLFHSSTTFVYVSPANGTDVSGCGNNTNPCQSFDYAYNSKNETEFAIVLCSGTYYLERDAYNLDTIIGIVSCEGSPESVAVAPLNGSLTFNLNSSTLLIDGITFSNSHAECFFLVQRSLMNVTIQNSIFSNVSGNSWVETEEEADLMFIQNNLFIDVKYAAIMNYYGSYKLESTFRMCTFQDAQIDSYFIGSGIVLSISDIAITNTTALSVLSCAFVKVEITNVTITNIMVGGSIFGITNALNVTLSDVTISNNNAYDPSALIYGFVVISSGNITLNGLTMENNIVGNRTDVIPVAISIGTATNLQMQNVIVRHHQFASGFLNAVVSTAITNSSFEDNHSTYYGGVLSNYLPGAIDAHDIQCFMSISNSTFQNNSAQIGGALALQNTELKLQASQFNNNIATTHLPNVDACPMTDSDNRWIGGGAIFIISTAYGFSTSIVTNSSVFSNNTDGSQQKGVGGAILCCPQQGEVYVDLDGESTFSQNEAPIGDNFVCQSEELGTDISPFRTFVPLCNIDINDTTLSGLCNYPPVHLPWWMDFLIALVCSVIILLIVVIMFKAFKARYNKSNNENVPLLESADKTQ